MGEVTVSSTINDYNEFFKVKYPINIHYGSSGGVISEFTTKTNLGLDEKHNLIKQIIAEHENNKGFIPMGFLTNLAYENNFTFDFRYITDNEVLYVLIFEEEREQLFWSFLCKYNWTANDSNDNLHIHSIDNLTAYVGYTFSYLVDVNGSNPIFSDYTYLFDIDNESGLIEFMPNYEDIGEHHILISVENEFGKEDSIILNLNIFSDNHQPSINSIGYQSVNLTSRFKYKVNASDLDNDTLFYFLETPLENIDIDTLTGEISYTSSIDDVGLYPVKVTVTDINGLYDEELFNLEVKDE